MYVEHPALAGNGLGHLRIAVTDHRDVVVAVQITAALRGIEVDAITPDEMQRFVVEQRRSAHDLATPGQQIEFSSHIFSLLGKRAGISIRR
ncbi:hypothetical protein D9M71_718310 [compost metagenome]